MATRETPFAPGTPCWVDLLSSDVAAATSFYSAVLGWDAEETGPDFGHYVNFTRRAHRVAGMMPSSGEAGTPDMWTTYLATTDAAASAAAAEAAGGTVVAPAMDVMDLGRMAVLVDPAGAPFGLWEAGTHTGFTLYDEPGGVVWDELHSTDYDAVKPFYAALFGYRFHPVTEMDEESFRYDTLTVDGVEEAVAGAMDATDADAGSHWSVYFSVEDTDAAVGVVEQHGGRVLMPPTDSPFGRMSHVADPTGVGFMLAQT